MIVILCYTRHASGAQSELPNIQTVEFAASSPGCLLVLCRNAVVEVLFSDVTAAGLAAGLLYIRFKPAVSHPDSRFPGLCSLHKHFHEILRASQEPLWVLNQDTGSESGRNAGTLPQQVQATMKMLQTSSLLLRFLKPKSQESL